MSAAPAIKNGPAKQVASSPSPKAVIQPKLMVNEPGDRYEQEADAMAERVMRMPQEQAAPVQATGLIGRSVQRKCAHCEEEEKKRKGAGTIMRKAECSTTPSVSYSTINSTSNLIQRKCAQCEEEEKMKRSGTVMRKANGGGAFEASANVTQQLSASRGGGSPLPGATRSFMENAFSTDFSKVRVHTDSTAAAMSREVNAKAFTYGSDIYFKEGAYQPQTLNGKGLLAHELGHVVQQEGPSLGRLQREEGDADTPDTYEPRQEQTEDNTADEQEDNTTVEDVEPAKEYDPRAIIISFLEALEGSGSSDADVDTDTEADIETDDLDIGITDEEATNDKSDVTTNPELEDATTWLGTGPEAERRKLLVEVELEKLTDVGYQQLVIDSYYIGNETGDEIYLASVKTDIDYVADKEATTMASINSRLIPNLNERNFIDDKFIIKTNGANAFPDLTWKILYPLIKPPDEYARTRNAYDNCQKDFYSTGPALTTDMINNGIPKSYGPSLGLNDYPYYNLIKNKKIPRLPGIPSSRFLYEFFVLPEEENLHTDPVRDHANKFSFYARAAVEWTIYQAWVDASSLRWPRFNTYAISSFRSNHPSGIGNLEQFYKYKVPGFTADLNALFKGAALGANGGGMDPYRILSGASGIAQTNAIKTLADLVKNEAAYFQKHLANANVTIAGLSERKKFTKAVNWSIDKGFAEASMLMLLDNVDTILFEMTKEWLKELGKDWVEKKGLKKLATSGLAFMVPGLGLAIALYNIWDFVDDARDKYELYELVQSFLVIINEAKSSSSVIQTQYSSARIAQAYETIFRLILQKLGSKLLGKLSSGAQKKLDARANRKANMSDARREDLISETYKEDNAKKLDEPHLDAEIQSAIRSTAFPSTHQDYDVEIAIPNSHTWSRIRGSKIWCRSSSFCTIPAINSPFFDELNRKADGVAVKSTVDTEDMGKQLTDEVGLSPSVPQGRNNVSKAVADAIGGGFVSEKGIPLTVDLAVQKHSQASDVRSALGITGQTQSAHGPPTAVTKQDDAYSRGAALTVLMPRDMHKAFDDHWKKKAIELRQKGETEITVAEFMKIMYDAVDQTPGLNPKQKGTLQLIIRTEVYKDLGWLDTDVIDLPYPNIK